MKSLTSRCGAALLCATVLAACGGGGGGDIPLGGTWYGLNRAGLILTNKGKDLEITDLANQKFAFTEYVAQDAEFEITVKHSPDGQQCKESNNKGRANYYSYQQTVITCTTDLYTLGGTITGLTAEGLVLNNGNLTVAPRKNETSFSFGKTVPNQLNYSVTVLAQPAGQVCTVQNGAGKMPLADKFDVVVDCK